MNSDKIIIDSIAEKAQVIIDENIKKAEATCNDIIKKAEDETAKQLNDCLIGVTVTLEEAKKRKSATANLDSKKMIMSAKSKAVDMIFEKALHKIIKLDDDKYLAIIKGMLKANASDGDIVIISNNDKKRITKKFLDGVAKELGIKLELAKEYGDFLGGVVLSNVNYDKNLTLEVELNAMKESANAEFVAKLIKE